MSEHGSAFDRAQYNYDHREPPEYYEKEFNAEDHLRYNMSSTKMGDLDKSIETLRKEDYLLYMIAIQAKDSYIRDAADVYRKHLLDDIEKEYNT